MHGRDYAYLDLAALPALGAALLAARPTLLFSADGRRILYANAAGAAFFGERRMESLLERRFAPALPATEQIARAARSLAPGASRLERIRFAVGAGFGSLAAECIRMTLPDGEAAVLVRLPEPAARRGGAPEAARQLVGMLAADDCLVAVLDAEGRPIAESGDFELFVGSAAIPDLVAAASRQPGRPLKRAIRIDDFRRPAGLAAAKTPEGLVHLLVVGPAERIAIEPPEPADDLVDAPEGAMEEISSEPVVEPAAVGEVPFAAEGVRVAAAAVVAQPAPEPEPAPSVMPTVVADTAEEVEAPEPTPAVATIETPASAETPEPVAAEPASADGFAYVEPAGPVRFVFQMDAEGRFTFVSPDFAEIVGPEAAIAVGETWAGMAARLGLDPTGAVARLIARRDTWSGVSLDWPIAGGHRLIAVDLAALPAFSRERLFEGYRGFGVIRPLERREAPPPSAATPLTESNVIRLARPAAEHERLSGPEQDAFRRIAAALGAAKPAAVSIEAPLPAQAEAPATEASGVVAPGAEGPEVAPEAERPESAIAQPAAEPAVGAPPVPEPESSVAVPEIEPPAAEHPLPELPAEMPDAPFAEPESASEPQEEAGFELEPLIEPPAAVMPQPEPEPEREPEPQPEPARAGPAPDAGAAIAVAAAHSAAASALAEMQHSIAELAAARQLIVELEAILDTATDGIIVVDEDARIERINRSAEALFGVETAAVAGLRLPDLLAEESRQSALDYIDGLARNGVASVLNDGREVIGRVPQGGLIPLFMTMGRLPETGKFCAVLRDITQWKNAEGELINAKRAAESASMQKSDFLAKVSHEIRTPLNAIIGFSEVMMEERFGPIGTERYKEYLRDINISGAHLMSLLNDLLDLSKIEAGKLDLSFEAVALNDIVMECVALMQPQANRERIIIRTSLSGQVPSIVADPRSIRQIVLNLVSNAVKFTLAGGQVIVSTAMEPHGEVTLRIRDTGIGMSEKDIETALKPFRQLSASRERRSDGTGLGLPLTKALVEANRAAFAIDSSVGQGTLIRITFPATRVLAG